MAEQKKSESERPFVEFFLTADLVLGKWIPAISTSRPERPAMFVRAYLDESITGPFTVAQPVAEPAKV